MTGRRGGVASEAVKAQKPARRGLPTQSSTGPAPKTGIFTDELGPPQVFPCEDQAAFFRRVRASITARRAGARTEAASATVSFESLSAFLAVVTPRRATLVDTVASQGPFESIQALSHALHRDRSAVSRDVKELAGAGLLRVRKSSTGPGSRSEIAMAGASLRFER